MRKKSYHEFVIKGLNQERFFNKLASSFDVYDSNRYEKNKTSFKVDIKNGKKVKKIILSSGFELLGEKRRGLIAKLLDFRHAYGIIAGVVVSVSLYLIQLPVIWKISINGVSYDIQEQICEFIKDNYKLHKYDLNCKQLEIELRNNFDNLSFVSIAVLGQSLVINAKEGDAPSEKTEVFSPIVCPIDCKIEDISLIQGTLNVHAGEIVRTGENLVLPYIIDASGNEKKVEPKAIIKVQSWLVGNESHKEEE